MNALQITLKSTLEVWKSIQESVTFLSTRRINQDPLENLFGSIRQQGGNCDTPTALQFSQAFRKMFFNQHLLPMGTGNCAADLDSILVTEKAIKEKKSQPKDQESSNVEPLPFNELQDEEFKSSTVEEKILSDNATTHVSGYLLTKCFEKHSCQTCYSVLFNNRLDHSSC